MSSVKLRWYTFHEQPLYIQSNRFVKPSHNPTSGHSNYLDYKRFMYISFIGGVNFSAEI